MADFVEMNDERLFTALGMTAARAVRKSGSVRLVDHIDDADGNRYRSETESYVFTGARGVTGSFDRQSSAAMHAPRHDRGGRCFEIGAGCTDDRALSHMVIADG